MNNIYDACVNALITFLSTEMASRFTKPSAQISKADDTILNSGYPCFCIMYPGAVTLETSGAAELQFTYEVLVDLNVRWVGSNIESWAAFSEIRSELINALVGTERGQTLGKVQYVKRITGFSADGRPRYIPVRGATSEVMSVAFIAQTFVLPVLTTVMKER